MKNLFKFFGIFVFSALLVFSMTACGDDTPGAESVTYTSSDSANDYELVITQKTAKAYTPQPGDTYVLTITPKDGGTPKTSSGTVEKINASGYDLKPTNGDKFTVTTNNSGEITKIEGDITLVGGTKHTPTGTQTPGTGGGSGTQKPGTGGNEPSGGGKPAGNPLANTTWEATGTRANILGGMDISEQVLIDAGIPEVLTWKLIFADSTVTATGHNFEFPTDWDDDLGKWGITGEVIYTETISTETYTVTGDTVTWTFTSGPWKGDTVTGTINGNKLVTSDGGEYIKK